MVIKSYSAPTVAGALKMIRQEMGGDAVILKTRLCEQEEAAINGNRVEVTACVDQPLPTRATSRSTAAAAPKKTQSKASDQSEDSLPELISIKDNYDFAAMLEKKLDFILNSHRTPEPATQIDRRLRPIYLNLLDADLPVEIARQLVTDMEANLTGEEVEAHARRVLEAEVKGCLADEVLLAPGMKAVFVGPSGAGKTTALGRLAAVLSVDLKQKVRLSSLDQVKVAAYEEIGGYAEILGLPLDSGDRPNIKRGDESILLIDTPALSVSGQKQDDIQRKIQRLQPDVTFLVFSACTRSRDLIDAVGIFEALTPTYLIAGHLDETERWGGILALSKYLDVPLAYISDSGGGTGFLKSPDATAIASRILKWGRTSDGD